MHFGTFIAMLLKENMFGWCTKIRNPGIGLVLHWQLPDVHIFGTNPLLLYIYLCVTFQRQKWKGRGQCMCLYICVCECMTVWIGGRMCACVDKSVFSGSGRGVTKQKSDSSLTPNVVSQLAFKCDGYMDTSSV